MINKKLKLNIFGRDLFNYLIVDTLEERAWVDFGLKVLRIEILGPSRWYLLKEIELNDCIKKENPDRAYLIIGDKEAVEVLENLTESL